MKLKSRVIMYLLFGILLTTAGTSVTLSKYMSTVSGATSVPIAVVALDGAEIVFNVSGISPKDEDNNTRTYQFEVTNQNIKSGANTTREFTGKVSEVNQTYSLIMDHSNNLPLAYMISEVTDNAMLGTKVNFANSSFIADDGNGFTVITYTGGAFPFDEDAAVHTYEITVTWDADVTNYDDWLYYQEVDYIGIRVESEQVD